MIGVGAQAQAAIGSTRTSGRHAARLYKRWPKKRLAAPEPSVPNSSQTTLLPSLPLFLSLSSSRLVSGSHSHHILPTCSNVSLPSLTRSLPLVLSLTISLSSLLSFFLSLGSPLALGLGLLYVRSIEGTIGIPTCSNGSLLSPSSHHPTPHDHVCPHDRAALNLPNLCEARRSARCAALFSHAKVISPGARLSPEHRHAVPLALQNPLLLATL